MKAGRLTQGGSTLTQQLVKKVLLSPKRTFGLKGLEAILSLYIEHVHSKEEILTIYLNRLTDPPICDFTEESSKTRSDPHACAEVKAVRRLASASRHVARLVPKIVVGP